MKFPIYMESHKIHVPNHKKSSEIAGGTDSSNWVPRITWSLDVNLRTLSMPCILKPGKIAVRESKANG